MTGILSRTNNRIEKAVQAYRRGLAMIDEHQPILDRFRPEVHNNLGYLYTTQGDPQAAIAELEIAAIEYQKLAVKGEPYNKYFGYEASDQTPSIETAVTICSMVDVTKYTTSFPVGPGPTRLFTMPV